MAVISHISNWLNSWMQGVVWQYDMKNILTLVSIVYGYVAVAPVVVWLLFRLVDTPMKLVPVACLFGYSLFVFIPATVRILLAY